jgi:high-affinity iron transporter
MLSTFIIAIREGLEASLIVGILVAYLVKSDRKELLKPLWLGVAAAIVTSLGLGAFLSFTSAELSDRGEQLFAGLTSIGAVALVTWMVFWMKRTARGLRYELHGKIDKATLAGPFALATAAFLAVVREGLETALFLYTNFQTVADSKASTIGLVIGLGVAVILGYCVYKSSIKMNLSKFFTYTGVALVIVAAGVLSHGVYEFQELGYLPGVSTFAWDISAHLPAESLLGATLSGTIGFETATSWMQFAVWSTYLIAVLVPYLSKPRAKVTVNA